MDNLLLYLKKGRLLQLATISAEGPWICTVYYTVDDSLNLYWLSWPSRRHSRELAEDNRAAGAVVIKEQRPVIGVQLEGRVSVIKDIKSVKAVTKDYVKKYKEGQNFYANFVTGRNEHVLYKLQPHRVVVFDEVNSMSNPRKKWRIVKGEVIDE